MYIQYRLLNNPCNADKSVKKKEWNEKSMKTNRKKDNYSADVK